MWDGSRTQAPICTVHSVTWVNPVVTYNGARSGEYGFTRTIAESDTDGPGLHPVTTARSSITSPSFSRSSSTLNRRSQTFSAPPPLRPGSSATTTTDPTPLPKPTSRHPTPHRRHQHLDQRCLVSIFIGYSLLAVDIVFSADASLR